MPGYSDFESAFTQYLDDVEHANSEEAAAFFFLEFVRKVFSGANSDFAGILYPILQQHLTKKKATIVLSGRADAMLGNLIIEFKQDLRTQLDAAESQLRLYISILWSNQGAKRVTYQVMACDGVHIKVYRPTTKASPGKSVDPGDVVLEALDEADLKGMKKTPQKAFVWLDRYTLYNKQIQPTGDLFAERFGHDSPSYRAAALILQDAWKESNGVASTVYEEWGRYLRYVYGTEVASEELFLKHTYLATLAKLVVYSYYTDSKIEDPAELVDVLKGLAFRKKGILNFLEEDFFSWVGREEVVEEGLKVAALILDVLKTFNLANVDEDVLKELYQELVDPSERHELGEYYTPDWLAEHIVEGALKASPAGKVLDPACGSGTFLVSAIHYKQNHLKSLKASEILAHMGSSVVGIDIHPLAVIIAKANYLIAIRDLLRQRSGSFSLPVYMANSIVLPAEVQEYSVDPAVKSYVRTVKSARKTVTLAVPTVVAEDPELIDAVISTMRDYAGSLGDVKSASQKDFENRLELNCPQFVQVPKHKVMAAILFETAKTMKDLIDAGKDTIWSYILKNIYKPLFLSKEANRFDALIGNPPWLSFRYVEDVEYQKLLKTYMMKYGIFPEAALVTQMELATLFMLRTADLYLKDSGSISFVMPRSVFSADQHDRFRRHTQGIELDEISDLFDVTPLFKIPSCVLTAKKVGKTAYPVDGAVFEGKLSKKNVKLQTALDELQVSKTKFVMCQVGERSFWMEGTKPLKFVGQSPYFSHFTQGATIVPRSCWMVDVKADPKLGFNPRSPYLESSKRAIDTAKKPYEDVRLKGNVESSFLYAAVTGSELVPFAHADLPIVVLPILPDSKGFSMLERKAATAKGYDGLSGWLKQVEETWKAKRGEKAERMTIYDRLNYQNTLTGQRPKSKYKVVYNASGTNLAACVIKQDEMSVMIGDQELKLGGVVADAKVYRFETNDEDEAYYITSVLNSSVLGDLVKPMQSRGLLGERDFHKKPLEFPIPKFDSSIALHRDLARLGKECAKKSKKALPSLIDQYTSLGKTRGEIRKLIADELKMIDEGVSLILKKNKGILDSFA